MLFESDESLPPVLQNEGIIWLSPTEISNGIVPIFDGQPKMEDVLQGFHGGVFLTGVITLINTNKTENLRGQLKSDIKDLFQRECILEYAFYKHNGETEKVQINCLLPTRNGKLVFAQAPNDVFWCPLFEKAYAKFRGGYKNVSLNCLDETIFILYRHLLFCDQTRQHSEDSLWRIISENCNSGKPVVCKKEHSNGNNGEYIRGFAVIGVKIVNNGKVVQVRDPTKTTIDSIRLEDFEKIFDVIGFLGILYEINQMQCSRQ